MDAAEAYLPADGSANSTDAPSAAPPDAECIRRALAGDRSAFAAVAISWQDRIYNALRKMTGNEQDAADLTQETFLRALDNLASFRGEASAYTWLFRIATNLATSRFRQIRRRRTVQAGQLQSADPDDSATGVLDARPAEDDPPEMRVETKERNRMVMEALQRLADDQRQLLVLRDIEGMDYQQIANVLQVPLGTIKSRLFRARLALREELKGYLET
jgi:RNA polymerase sigma-70 factor (ECF subfamily)